MVEYILGKDAKWVRFPPWAPCLCSLKQNTALVKQKIWMQFPSEAPLERGIMQEETLKKLYEYREGLVSLFVGLESVIKEFNEENKDIQDNELVIRVNELFVEMKEMNRQLLQVVNKTEQLDDVESSDIDLVKFIGDKTLAMKEDLELILNMLE